MISELAPPTKEALARARGVARRHGAEFIGGDHVLAALAVCDRMPTDVAQALRALPEAGGSVEPGSVPSIVELTHEVRHSLATTWRIATIVHVEAPEPEHLLLGLLAEPASAAEQSGHEVGLSFAGACQEIVGWAIPRGILGPHTLDQPDGAPVELSLEEFGRVFDRLKTELPDGAPLAFNMDDTHAWVRTGRDVDLAAAIRRIETHTNLN